MAASDAATKAGARDWDLRDAKAGSETGGAAETGGKKASVGGQANGVRRERWTEVDERHCACKPRGEGESER